MMSDTILTIGLVLSGLLLAFTTYAAFYGVAGSFTGSSYERCPLCHDHYLAGKSGAVSHQCTKASVEPAPHLFHGLRHHAHAGRS
jgi:hypothetical protein